jgi:hypothetical protein
MATGEFAFIIHPVTGAKDVARKYPALRWVPEAVLEQLLKRMSPKPVSERGDTRARQWSTRGRRMFPLSSLVRR